MVTLEDVRGGNGIYDKAIGRVLSFLSKKSGCDLGQSVAGAQKQWTVSELEISNFRNMPIRGISGVLEHKGHRGKSSEQSYFKDTLTHSSYFQL